MLTEHNRFRRCRPSLNATRAAVIADACVRNVNDFRVGHVVVVDVANNRSIHVRNASVVSKVIVVPITAFIPAARVSMTVVNAAVEANVRAPITGVPQIAIA
jgi:hypothetical protein